MEILVKGKKAAKPIFGCLGCECVFTANADEFYYDSNDETNYCCCPECGAKCTGTEISCYFCEYTEQCEYKSAYEYDQEICHSFRVNKSKLWKRLGYQRYQIEED